MRMVGYWVERRGQADSLNVHVIVLIHLSEISLTLLHLIRPYGADPLMGQPLSSFAMVCPLIYHFPIY